MISLRSWGPVLAMLLAVACGGETEAREATSQTDGLVSSCSQVQPSTEQLAKDLLGVMEQLEVRETSRFSDVAMRSALDTASDSLIDTYDIIAEGRWNSEAAVLRSAVADVDGLSIGASLDEQGEVLNWLQPPMEAVDAIHRECEQPGQDDASERRDEFLEGE